MKLTTGDKIDISCTWGDGPDVCVNIKHDPKKRICWPDGFFPIDLTADEANDIGKRLIEASKQAKEIDRSYRDRMKNEPEGETGD